MSEADDFDALAALLPFYVNGSLSPEQHASVSAALQQMPELRAELTEVEAIASLVKDGSADWMTNDTAVPAERLEKLMSQIAKEPSRSAAVPLQRTIAGPADRNVRSQPFRQRLFQPPYSMALAVGLAAVTLMQGALLFNRQAQPVDADASDAYASLSGPGQVRDTVLFTLRLNANARWGDVLVFLDDQGLRIVAGPQDGMIDVAPDVAPDASLSPSQIDALEQRLRRSALVVFVGRGS